MLPFGLRSVPKIFDAMADALEWCVAKQGVWHIYHNLDNLIILGFPSMKECSAFLSTLQRVCQELDVMLALEEKSCICLHYRGCCRWCMKGKLEGLYNEGVGVGIKELIKILVEGQ